MEFIHIVVNNQNYLLSAEKIKEIIKYPMIKPLADSSEYIEGIISHKEKIIPIISIRKLLRFESFSDEQIKLLKKVEGQHISWMHDFEAALTEGKPFTKALDPHKCDLGKWIDETLRCMRCNHNGYTDIIKEAVIPYHNALHSDVKKILEKPDKECLEKHVQAIKVHGANTHKGLSTLEEEIHRLSSAFEQLIIYNIDGVDVGFIVDRVAQMHHLDEKRYHLGSEPLSKSNEFIQFIDHYEIKNNLLFSMKFTRFVSELVTQWKEKEVAVETSALS